MVSGQANPAIIQTTYPILFLIIYFMLLPDYTVYFNKIFCVAV